MRALADKDRHVRNKAQEKIGSDPLLGLLVASLKGDAGS